MITAGNPQTTPITLEWIRSLSTLAAVAGGPSFAFSAKGGIPQTLILGLESPITPSGYKSARSDL